MATTDEESVEARLQRLRELRDRGPVSGSIGPVDPEEMKAKRQRLRELREQARAQPGNTADPDAAAAPSAPPRSALPAAMAPGADALPAAGGDAVRQKAAGFLLALRSGGTQIAGTAYTEEGVGKFLDMLKAASDRPFFDRLYKFCMKPAQDGEATFKEANLTSLGRVVELLERIQAEGLESVREQLRGRGQPGVVGDGPPRGRPAGAGGFGAMRRPGAGGPGGGPGGGLGGGPGGGPGAGLLERLDRRAEMEGARAPNRPAAEPADAAQVRELNDRIAQLEQMLGELKAQLGKKS